MVLSKLGAFARGLLPALVVSCKCDASQRQLNPNSIEQVGIIGGYETMQTSASIPDSQKKCLTVILNMITRKNGEFDIPAISSPCFLGNLARRLVYLSSSDFSCRQVGRFSGCDKGLHSMVSNLFWLRSATLPISYPLCLRLPVDRKGDAG
jgi:hypothetical protein